MNLLLRSRFETISGSALFFQILVAVSQRRNTVLRGEIHESRQRRLAQLSGASQRDLIFAIKLERQQSGSFLGEVALLQICCPQKR